MILRSILHSTWIEWREQRSNLLGLWAGLLLLILAMALFGGFDLVTDAAAPVAFALIGYLGFVLTIMPRIFTGSKQRATEGLQRRCPAGIHGNFLGKALFLNLAMALSALLPALTVLVLIYISAPRTYAGLANEPFYRNGFGVLFAMYAIPLMLMSWRLPARWVVVVLPLTACVVLGSLSLGALGTSTSQGIDPVVAGVMVLFGFLLVPWLTTWSSFTITGGATKLRRASMGLGLTCLAMSPALGIGLHGYVRNGFSFTTFDHESEDFFIEHAYLGPNGQEAYLTSYDRKNPANVAELLHFKNDYRQHALRVDLSTGSFERWPNRRFLVPTKEGLQESGPASYPHVPRLILHGMTGGHSDSLHTVDLTTNELAPIDPEQFAVDCRPNVEAMGLEHPWRRMGIDVGLGTYLWAPPKQESSKRALYDPSRSRVFSGNELPFTLGKRLRRVLVLPGKWLIGPEEGQESWMRFDPDHNALEPIQGLEQGASIGRALPDGKVIVFKGGRFSLYDANEDLCEALVSVGGPTEGPQWTFLNAMGSRQRCAPAHLIMVTNRDHVPMPVSAEDKPTDTFLGRLDRDTNEIHWLPWSRHNRIVGAIDQDNLLFTQSAKRLARIDLNTGKEEILFPRPSESE